MFRREPISEESGALDPNRSIALFEGLCEDNLRELVQTHFPGTWSAKPGGFETSHTLHVIEEGKVEITLPIGQGMRNVPVLIALGPGDFFGETRLLFEEPLARPRVVSESGARGRCLSTHSRPGGLTPLECLVAASPRVGANLIAETCRRLLSTSRFVPSHAAPLRLGYFLLGATTNTAEIVVAGTSGLTSQLGLSGPAVVHALTTLEGAGLLAVDRGSSLRIRVIDRDALTDYLGITHTGHEDGGASQSI
jgi:CRP-like cAMP-binding protein